MAQHSVFTNLSSHLGKNGLKSAEFIGYIGHKENVSVYGCLFRTENGLVFQKHKWTEINKTKAPPKVCADLLFTYKEVSEDIWNSFRIIDDTEYMEREVLDMQNIR